MRCDTGFPAHCTELLGAAGTVRAKRMFGGYGLYLDEVFVAIVANQALYLKVDEATRPCFEAAGGYPFTYTRQGKRQSTAFWTPPAEAMDSPALMQPWVQLALQAALGARPTTGVRR